MTDNEEIKKNLDILLKKYELKIDFINEIFYLIIDKKDLINIIKLLKEDKKILLNQLSDITAVDYINQNKRFKLVYIFLSHKINFRLILTINLEDGETAPSICEVFESANWYERECYDLFGIIFENHPDLRRIMTDYNFQGHPLRKDFPLTGHTEVRYDNLEKKVVYEPVKLPQEYRNFDYSSPWEGLNKDINKDDEK
ncbi:MAG: NADH-quinone oxidoreductase chain 5 [Alphaproteobacteria bacterium MarineAlpha5_Bin12]|nr:MAG: NADH-quinone oxidoreductase chain 5 [Alphaproteobacteria bacterium MarineAlpha5_Bin12]|tara:strand:- start:11847 stop:12440 length:594 start_codon:yes stop_codon:yes gene_type:complete